MNSERLWEKLVDYYKVVCQVYKTKNKTKNKNKNKIKITIKIIIKIKIECKSCNKIL